MTAEVTYLPPQDLDAEQACLGAMLLRPDGAKELARLGVEPRHFYREVHQTILRVGLELATAMQPVDRVTVAAKLRDIERYDACGGFEYLDRLTNSTPYSTHLEAYATRVKDCAARRSLLWLGHKIQDTALEEPDPQAAFATAYEKLTGLIGRHGAQEQTTWQGEPGVAEWLRCITEPRKAIPTGFPTLDWALCGGFYRHQVYALTAYTKQGKSALVCCWIVAAVKKGFRVGLASLEMPMAEVVSRCVAIETGIPYRSLHRGWDRLGPHDRERATNAAQCLLDYLVVDEANGYGIPEMTRRLSQLRQDGGADLLILDLFNNVQGQGNDTYGRAASVNAAIQDLPGRLGCPLVLVAQQNRTMVDGEPTLNSIKGCGDVGERSPVVMALSRKDDDEGHTTGRLFVLGNRDGYTPTIPLTGNRDTYAWTETPAEQEPAKPARAIPVDYTDPEALREARERAMDAADADDPFARE